MQLIIHDVERDADGAGRSWAPKRWVEQAPSAFTLGSAGDMLIDWDDQVMTALTSRAKWSATVSIR